MKALFTSKSAIFAFMILLALGVLFYCFQYRPSEIRKKCLLVAKEGKNLSGVLEKYGLPTSSGIERANRDYSDCLVGEGLPAEKLYE